MRRVKSLAVSVARETFVSVATVGFGYGFFALGDRLINGSPTTTSPSPTGLGVQTDKDSLASKMEIVKKK